MSVEKFINPGVETLVEIGVVSSLAIVRDEAEKGGRNEILNCLGCRLEKGEDGITGIEVAECSGMNKSTISVALVRLEKAGILDYVIEDDPDIPNHRKRYSIKDNKRGRKLLKTIVAPPECGLDL
jgi:DNA-binding transcriptional ArsR family regulator